ncbi:MAG: hypothetical protein WDZ41_04385 [Candidatus Babeliales bacterium]
MKSSHIILFISLTLCFTTIPMETEKLHSIFVPAQNGYIPENYAQKITFDEPIHAFNILHNPVKDDFGQNYCIADFKKQLDETFPEKLPNLKLYGSSQGTATLINWLADQPIEMQNKVKCLILESVIGSGNNAIVHTCENLVKPIGYLPFAHYWLPICAKICFPHYNPLGKQALNSAKKLPNNLPIIIMHAITDPQLSINDARELYCTLREKGNDNIYLFEINTDQPVHSDILRFETNMNRHQQNYSALQHIFEKYNLPYNKKIKNELRVNLKNYQPNTQEVKNKIKKNTEVGNFIKKSINTFTGLAAASYLYSFFSAY